MAQKNRATPAATRPRKARSRPAPSRAHGALSIILLTRDHARALRESLPMITAEAARRGARLFAFDTASTDGSADLLREAGFDLTDVAPADFAHGRTRNAAAARAAPASGDTVVFLNGDAVPLPGWLDGLVDGFALHPRVAAVFSRQIPPPGTDPLRVSDLEGHCAFGSDLPRVSVLDDDRALPHDPAALRAVCTFDTVSCAIRAGVLKAIPFPDVGFGEDLLWGRAALEAGHALAYAPSSMVLHCHDLYAHPLDLVRRHFDDAQLARVVAGHADLPDPARFAAFMAGAVVRDLKNIARADMAPAEMAAWAALGPAARAAQYLATQAGYFSYLLPPTMREFLSWRKKS